MTAASATSPPVESEQQHRYRVDGMDCAACARTVEKVVSGIPGADEVQVSFGNGMLVVIGEAPPAAVHSAVRRAGYSVRESARGESKPFWRRSARALSAAVATTLLLVAVTLSIAGAPAAVTEALYLSSMVAGGWAIARSALAALTRRSLDMNVLMTMAALGAVAIGEFAEAAWVLVLFAIGTTIETFALERSRRAVEALMDLAPQEARLLGHGGSESMVAVEAVETGSHIRIRPGERVPLDGLVVAGASSIDESAITGESVPVDKGVSDGVYAGTLNAFGALTIQVTALAEDSTLARVAKLVSQAQGSQAPSERFVDRFAKYYTPIVFVSAIAVAAIPTALGADPGVWIYRALALLIVACPCALVISVPVSVVSAIGGAARRGVLLKSGQALEDLGRVKVVALDKTGTLTEGRPRLASVWASESPEPEALRLMAAVERDSEHPLAIAIVEAARAQELEIPTASEFAASPGRGATAVIDGRNLWAGGPRLAADMKAHMPDEFGNTEGRGETAVALGEGDRVLGVFGLADTPRSTAATAVARLRQTSGIEQVVMLTGDSDLVAKSVATATGIDEWRAGLLPQDKLDAIAEMRMRYGETAMVGDGVNDAPALAGATVGVAMGAAGSDVALESADVALMGDELERLPDAIVESQRALRVMRQNVVVSLATKAIFVMLAPLGYVSLVMAVAADMGISLLVTLNGLRLLGAGNRPDTRNQVEMTPDDVCDDECCGAPLPVSTEVPGGQCEDDCGSATGAAGR